MYPVDILSESGLRLTFQSSPSGTSSGLSPINRRSKRRISALTAWKSAEPGVLFWDTVLRESVPDCYADLGYRTVSTNPCGEIPLCPYDSCRLIAINLYSYVDKPFTAEAKFNFIKFKKHVRQSRIPK